MEYEAHFSVEGDYSILLNHDGSLILPNTKFTIFENFGIHGNCVMVDNIVTRWYHTESLNQSAAAHAFLSYDIERLSLLGLKVLRSKLECGPIKDCLYYEAHVKYEGYPPPDVWLSKSCRGGQWATIRSSNLDVLKTKFWMNENWSQWNILEKEIESVVIDTNPEHEFSKGWGLYEKSLDKYLSGM